MSTLAGKLPTDAPDDWLDAELYCQQRGLKWSTVRGWKQRYWQHGVQYAIVGHTTLLNPKEISEWIKNRNGLQGSNQEGGGCGSEFGNTANRTTTKRSRVTPIQKVTSPQR